MSVKVFLIGVLIFSLICVAIVFLSWRKGEDWKITSIFMSIGWLIAVGQLAGNIK